MDFLLGFFHTATTAVDLNAIIFLLHATPFAYIIVLALFCCVLLLMSVFSRYKIFNLHILLAWILACFATFFYIYNARADMDSMQFSNALHSQIILSFGSIVILLIFYLLSLVGTKPTKKRKNFGYHAWWINILRFIVSFAFCCAFNIGLFVTSALFYW